MLNRPTPDECPPYYTRYVDLVKSGNIISTLRNRQSDTIAFLQNLPIEKWEYRYAPKKWTLKESWIHVIDAERVFAYRALRMARKDTTPLPGFEQNDYISFYNAAQRTPESVIEEYQAVRVATVQLFKNLPNEAWTFTGTASGHTFTPLVLAYIIAGHELHHINLTRERYL